MKVAEIREMTVDDLQTRVKDLDDETLNAIAESAVPPEYDGLDAMLKDWTP